MIVLKDLTVRYGDETALDSINLRIDEGTPITVVGKSGCGKSSLIYALSSLVEISSGHIVYEGELGEGFSRKTSVLLQSCGIFPWKTVLANTVFVAKAKGAGPSEALAAAESALRLLNIYDLKDKYPRELSGGQRQRSAIACAIVARPRLLLLDEPTAALDAFTKEGIDKALLRLYLENGTSYIMVTHDIEEAVFLGGKIAVMKKAGISRVLDNPFFGDGSVRDKLGFYKYCLEIRGCFLES